MGAVRPAFVGFANRRETVVFFGEPMQVRITYRGPKGVATVGIEAGNGETREQATNRARDLLNITESANR